jgi:hypothetical protein
LLQYGRKFTDSEPPGIPPDGIFDPGILSFRADVLKKPPESEQI